ncbi:DUF488 domain-containing protein [Chelatococcus asaccharovorans]|uniref:DUF488 domain-containing protein n=1 Tax=Chelatococcus asaccharovorans TaxID=28210 RepID=UPI00224C7A99|nr:DUF488 domain-containing protein [Chelatococcus asaccharovorans]CAH1661878.1 conserved hypothetical protein [Chelatococcus asaccharovorans]CAH1689412.1 conserved hypothetical protein [Chelatococcus asaccharovorans]
MSYVLKRVYVPPATGDGLRILVDRLWPRGLKKEEAAVDLWLKEVAPSAELRKWFGHEPEKWAEFRRRYRIELGGRKSEIETLRQCEAKGCVTLLYGARDEAHNHAVVLKEYIEEGS